MKNLLMMIIMLLAPSFVLSQNKDMTSNKQPSAEEQAVLQVERDRFDTSGRVDAKTRELLYIDDFVVTSTIGSVSVKQDVLRSPAPSSPRPNIDLIEKKVHIFGDAAVVTGILSFKFNTGGKENTTYMRFTDTLVRGKSGWQMAASHATQIPVWRAREMDNSELKTVTAVSCDQETSLKSLNMDLPAYIRFTNSTSQPITIYWINFEGKRDPSPDQIRMLKPGETRSIKTYLTHQFLVTDASGKCLGIYQPMREPGLAVIK